MQRKNKLEIGTSEAEIITGYSKRHLNRLVTEGIFTKSNHGKWDLKKLVTELVEYKLELETEPLLEKLKTFQDQDPDYRIKEIKAKREENAYRKEIEELVERSNITDFLMKFGLLIIKEFEPFERKCRDKFKFVDNDIEREIIIAEIKNQTFNAIADTNINSLLPDSFRNPAQSIIARRKGISKKTK